MLWRRFAESSVVSIGVEHRPVELVHSGPDVTAGTVLADPAAGADAIPDIRPREGCFLMRRHDMAAAMPRPPKMPPAATTGIGDTASTSCGTSTIVLTVPLKPPASPPWAMITSTLRHA